jgi:hypothetical protein
MQEGARWKLQTSKLDELHSSFRERGYLMLSQVVPSAPLSALNQELVAEFARAKRSGELFSGGGMISGHLNCFPGAQSRFVYTALQDAGVIELVRQLSPAAVRMPNIGCNFNLPGSGAQNHHVDGYADQPFMIVNVGLVKTTISNGAMLMSPASHKRDYKYWQFVCARHPTLRVEMNVGDVVLRPSTLWHRGMPNRSTEIRPMLGFTWEDGGSRLDDPYTAHAGKIKFLPNRYAQNFTGKLRERAFSALPALGAGYLFVRSLLR